MRIDPLPLVALGIAIAAMASPRLGIAIALAIVAGIVMGFIEQILK